MLHRKIANISGCGHAEMARGSPCEHDGHHTATGYDRYNREYLAELHRLAQKRSI